jgi:hypothetical protein
VKCSKELYKCAINLITNPNPVYSLTHPCDNIINFTTHPGLLLERHLGTLSYFRVCCPSKGHCFATATQQRVYTLQYAPRADGKKLNAKIGLNFRNTVCDLTDQHNVWFSRQFYASLQTGFPHCKSAIFSRLYELHA